MGSPATTAAIDQRLLGVGDAVERMAGAMIDLENDAARLLLPSAPLTGRTATAWAETEPRITALWELYPLARDAVATVTVERGTHSTLSTNERERLDASLSGPVVAIAPDLAASVHQVSEGLIDLPSRCTLDQLTDAFELLHQRVTAVLGEVNRIWDEVLPTLTALDQQLATVEAEAAADGVRRPNDLAVTRRLINGLRSGAAADPLDLDLGDLEVIRAGVQRAHDAMMEQGRAGALREGKLRDVTALLANVAAKVAGASQVRARAVERIAGAGALPTLDDAAAQLDQLRVELAQLRETGGDPDPSAARRLDRLVQNASRLDARVTQLAEQVGAGLARRDELRRLVEAYKAKAEATGRAEDRELDARYRCLTDLLYTAPCDLAEVAREFAAYQQAVNRRPTAEDRR